VYNEEENFNHFLEHNGVVLDFWPEMIETIEEIDGIIETAYKGHIYVPILDFFEYELSTSKSNICVFAITIMSEY
jgi:hypothetical protein